MENTKLIVEGEIKKLYHTYYQELCLISMSIIKDSDLAQDVVQEFFINYWERSSQGVLPAFQFKTYASRAVRNLSIDILRRQAVIEKRQDELITVTDADAYHFDQDESDTYYARLKFVFELIETLPKGQRTILKLHALDKLSYQQIATRQGVSINTVRTQLTRAYTKLRKSSTGLLLLYLLNHL